MGRSGLYGEVKIRLYEEKISFSLDCTHAPSAEQKKNVAFVEKNH